MIYINNIPSFRSPEEEEFIPDDRQERIEIIEYLKEKLSNAKWVV